MKRKKASSLIALCVAVYFCSYLTRQNYATVLVEIIEREGVSKADGAIVELIKNTYDADAELCFMCMDAEHDKIYLFDHGSGMDSKTIENCWIV